MYCLCVVFGSESDTWVARTRPILFVKLLQPLCFAKGKRSQNQGLHFALGCSGFSATQKLLPRVLYSCFDLFAQTVVNFVFDKACPQMFIPWMHDTIWTLYGFLSQTVEKPKSDQFSRCKNVRPPKAEYRTWCMHESQFQTSMVTTFCERSSGGAGVW